MELSSPAFRDGEPIPVEYGYTERNVNPPLEFRDDPGSAESLALVVDDPDAVEPAGTVWDHWIVWNADPESDGVPEDWTPGTAVEGRNEYGTTGYGGPNPPDGRHSYRVRLFALDATLDLEAGATKADLEASMAGHVLETAALHGTYAP
jgi:hypothetical protein